MNPISVVSIGTCTVHTGVAYTHSSKHTLPGSRGWAAEFKGWVQMVLHLGLSHNGPTKHHTMKTESRHWSSDTRWPHEFLKKNSNSLEKLEGERGVWKGLKYLFLSMVYLCIVFVAEECLTVIREMPTSLWTNIFRLILEYFPACFSERKVSPFK